MVRSSVLLALTFAALPFGHAAQAGQETVVHTFTGLADGGYPVSRLVRDPSGNLYGTAVEGGAVSPGGASYGDGTLFELSPRSAAAPAGTFTVLHTFVSASDGASPTATPARGPDGTLYGTTATGGPFGSGTVFSLSPPAGGQTNWSYQVLYTFQQGIDGFVPVGPLYRAASGALYGVTQLGGLKAPSGTGGLVYRLTPPAPGGTAWNYRVLYRFTGGSDGGNPQGGVIADAAGNLYGNTQYGGRGIGYGNGVVYRLRPPTGRAAAAETALYDFTGHRDGEQPQSELVLDTAGNLYGTTAYGGGGRAGVAFKLAPPASGQAQGTLTVLFSFDGHTGKFPSGPLLADGTGGFYGTTQAGGQRKNDGILFHLTPPAPGQTAWTETVPHEFPARGTRPDGILPFGGVTLTGSGWLVGTTSNGVNGDEHGTVFTVHP